MGNVVSASSKPIQDKNSNFEILQSFEPNESKQKKPLENPGTMEELHKRCKGKQDIIKIHQLSFIVFNTIVK